MKKLLLFILVLFGILSAQSLAGGCIAQVCTCPNGGYVSYGEYCASYSSPSYSPDYSLPKVWFAFSYDSTQKIYAIGEGENKKAAENDSLHNYGTSQCKVFQSVKEFDKTLLIVLSSNDIMELKSFNIRDRSVPDKNSSYYVNLLEKCRNKGGINCKIVFNSRYLLFQSRAYKKKFGY